MTVQTLARQSRNHSEDANFTTEVAKNTNPLVGALRAPIGSLPG